MPPSQSVQHFSYTQVSPNGDIMNSSSFRDRDRVDRGDNITGSGGGGGVGGGVGVNANGGINNNFVSHSQSAHQLGQSNFTQNQQALNQQLAHVFANNNLGEFYFATLNLIFILFSPNFWVKVLLFYYTTSINYGFIRS